MRPHHVFPSLLLLLVTTSTAWASIWQPLEVAKNELAPLFARAPETTHYDLSYSAKQGNTATTVKTPASQSSKDGKPTVTSSGSSSPAKTTGKDASIVKSDGKNTDKGKSPSSTYETTKTFDARLPPGGVQMVTPNPTTDASQYYKIADYVTFAWNFTSLSITPTAVDVLASCSANSETYTISANMSVTNATQAVTWDTGAYQATATVPLLTETYTLIIYDAGTAMSAAPRAGYLGLYDQFTFGMYVPQKYTPMADWVCVTCNSAQSSMERRTVGFLFGMVVVTVLSFGWFGGVAGLW